MYGIDNDCRCLYRPIHTTNDRHQFGSLLMEFGKNHTLFFLLSVFLCDAEINIKSDVEPTSIM